jgi:hypothetical protein
VSSGAVLSLIIFLAVNGVKQGGVLSPILFCLYIDDLLSQLSKSGVGRSLSDNFVGALAYADDTVILAPTASALRSMLAVCDKYASEYSISFKTSKSKCLVILPRRRRFLYNYLRKYSFYTGSNCKDYVDSFVHLGHVISQ